MTLRFEVRDLPDRLEYRVAQSHTRTDLILRTLAWMAAIAIAVISCSQSAVLDIFMSGMLVYFAAADIQKARRGTDVTLTITERDIISDGYTQNEYHPLNRWRTQAPDLSWKNSHSTEDGPAFSCGLYCGSDCVLPLISMNCGHRIVERIYARFPDTSSESQLRSFPVPSALITLGLSRN